MSTPSDAPTAASTMTGNVADLALVADIGGTNSRFAITDTATPELELLHARRYKNADYASLQHVIEAYLSEIGIRPPRAAIAVASPVNTDNIRLTNLSWSFNREDLRKALGFDELQLLNDFGAVAWSVPALTADHLMPLYVRNKSIQRGPVTVLGPGTGLGVAMLVGNANTGWDVIETEGGHVSFAPLNAEEELVNRWLTARHGRCSNERILCGSGIAQIDAVLRNQIDHATGQTLSVRDPADVVAAALAGHDNDARRTLARFCAILGSVCGDTALIHGSRALVIAGGIVPRFIPFLMASAFRERLLAKGRFVAYLENVDVFITTHPEPGLLGAANSLRNKHPLGP